MPRLTVPTKPKLLSFSSSVMRGSCAALSRNQALSSESGLASLMTIRRYGVLLVLASTESIHSWVSAKPL